MSIVIDPATSDITGLTAPLAVGAGVAAGDAVNLGQLGASVAELPSQSSGTWTPNQGSGLTVVGAFTSVGRWRKVGKIVTVSGYVQGGTSVACSSVGAISSNLPFPSTTLNQYGTDSNNGFTTVGVCMAGANSSNLYHIGTAMAATIAIQFSITYETP